LPLEQIKRGFRPLIIFNNEFFCLAVCIVKIIGEVFGYELFAVPDYFISDKPSSLASYIANFTGFLEYEQNTVAITFADTVNLLAVDYASFIAEFTGLFDASQEGFILSWSHSERPALFLIYQDHLQDQV
jgi:hypothetical protein